MVGIIVGHVVGVGIQKELSCCRSSSGGIIWKRIDHVVGHVFSWSCILTFCYFLCFCLSQR